MSIILNLNILEHNKCDYLFNHLPQTAMSNSLFACNLRCVIHFNQKKPNF